MTTVTLTYAEVLHAAQAGICRHVSALKAGRVVVAGQDLKQAWADHAMGAVAELALAKLLGVYWDPAVGRIDAGDVGELEVRATAREDGCLIVRPADPDSTIYVLAVGWGAEWRFPGWIGSSSAKCHPTRAPNGRPAAHFVPQEKLFPVENLPGLKAGTA